ncbi:hypothetical protein J2X15_004132 [Rhodoferax saidenbachensis]|uniref:Uncharacterized protein n=1 Tax=Rhodoferax saidenbachensis TaxID=1484693 RepID=A0ABU1ZTC4_9BURK|nr:hypothetical protein [Rhodoferax saidenbachensis]
MIDDLLGVRMGTLLGAEEAINSGAEDTLTGQLF